MLAAGLGVGGTRLKELALPLHGQPWGCPLGRRGDKWSPPSSACLPKGMNGSALDYFQVVFTCLVFLALCLIKGDGRDSDGQREGRGGKQETSLWAALSANHPQTFLCCLVAGSVLGTGARGECGVTVPAFSQQWRHGVSRHYSAMHGAVQSFSGCPGSRERDGGVGRVATEQETHRGHFKESGGELEWRYQGKRR